MAEITRRCALAVKVEAVAGTAESPTMAADAVRLLGAAEPEVFYLAPNGREELITGDIDSDLGAPPVGRCARFRLRFIPTGAGAAYGASSLPEHDALLQAGGYSRAIDTTEDAEMVTYTADADPDVTVTAMLQIGAKEYIIAGAVFESLRLAAQVGQFPVFDGVLVGVCTAITQQALESPTLDALGTVGTPVWVGSNSLLVGAYAPEGQSIDVDFGLTAAANTSNNAADGVTHWRIVNRRTIATVGMRVPALASFDPYTLMANATATTLDAVFGGTQYKRMKINADNVGIPADGVAHVDNGGFRDYNVQLLAGRHASNTFTLVFD